MNHVHITIENQSEQPKSAVAVWQKHKIWHLDQDLEEEKAEKLFFAMGGLHSTYERTFDFDSVKQLKDWQDIKKALTNAGVPLPPVDEDGELTTHIVITLDL